jgi:hypothetical protein
MIDGNPMATLIEKLMLTIAKRFGITTFVNIVA